MVVANNTMRFVCAARGVTAGVRSVYRRREDALSFNAHTGT
jgi:hypothetical protein